MKTYNTYQEILEDTGTHQVTAQQVLNRQIYIDGKGWQTVQVSPELRLQLAHNIAALLGGYQATQERVANNLYHNNLQHWGLSRIFFQQPDGKVRLNYCAGQDYPSEIASIRTYLKK